MQRTVNDLLKGLEDFLRDGTFTPARYIDSETFICFIEQTPNGILYHQGVFETLRPEVKQLFNHRVRGERAGPFKIVGVFDYWIPTSLALATVKYPS